MSITASFKNPPASTSSRKGSNIDADQFRKQTILRQRQRTLRQSFSKSGFRQSIMSFVDDTMSTLFRGQQKQISKQSAQSLQTFIKFTLILQKHLSSKDNIINMVINTFQNYIYKKYTIFNISNTIAKQIQNQISQMQKNQILINQLKQLQEEQDRDRDNKDKWRNKLKRDKQKDKQKQRSRIKILENRKSLTSDQIQELTNDIKIFLVLLREMVQDYYKTMEFQYQVGRFSHNGNTSIIVESSNQSYRSLQANNSNQNNNNNNVQQQQQQSQNNTNFLIINQDNILILVTAILFKNQKFYNHIFNIFKKYHEERQKNFKKIVQRLAYRPPQYFQVKRQYCLNQYTLGKFMGEEEIRGLGIGGKQDGVVVGSSGGKIKKNGSLSIQQSLKQVGDGKQKKQEKKVQDDLNNNTSNNSNNNQNTSTTTVSNQNNPNPNINININTNIPQTLIQPPTLSSSSSLLTTSLPKNPKPYTKCSQILQKLTKSKTPTSKMKTIMQCSQKITQSVSQFYNQYKIQLQNQVLDADQILSIFCYILSSNNIEYLHANLFMIEHFATENQMISVTGYYYSVLTIAIQQLQNMYSPTSADMETQSKHQSFISAKSNNTNSNNPSNNPNNLNTTLNGHSSTSPNKNKNKKNTNSMSASVSVKSQNSQSNNGNVGGKVKKDKVKRSFKVIQE